uniref:Transcriptional regulator, RHH-like, CopG n=1 Tax=Siphoviridae sp. ct9zP9 TaxID=2827795 RepID=A0A8S5SHR7_9CAUD|nr:MAG TPA: Transcriptional regulator, RHH-like, CopG [Siphoviridae sp. ct9zP9]
MYSMHSTICLSLNPLAFNHSINLTIWLAVISISSLPFLRGCFLCLTMIVYQILRTLYIDISHKLRTLFLLKYTMYVVAFIRYNHIVGWRREVFMEYSESKKKYNLEYAKKKLKRIPLDVQVEKYEEIKTAAATSGETINGYIKKAIDERMQRDKGNQ